MSAQDGVMQQIEQLLRDGKSSRQVIDMRYNPSSIYKVQRRVPAIASAPVTEGNDPIPPIAGLGVAQRLFWPTPEAFWERLPLPK